MDCLYFSEFSEFWQTETIIDGSNRLIRFKHKVSVHRETKQYQSISFW